MSYALCPNLEKVIFFAIANGSRFFVVCFVYNTGQTFFCQTPGRHPPHITGLRVISVTWGGSMPPASATRSDFMTQSMFLAIDV